MKAYQSDDGEIRFYFDREDIAVHNLQFSDLITSSAKSKKLLAQLLQYAHEHFGFNPSGNHLTIGAIPLGKDHLLLTLSDKDVSGKLPGGLHADALPFRQDSDSADDADFWDEEEPLLFPEDATEVPSDALLADIFSLADSDSSSETGNSETGGADSDNAENSAASGDGQNSADNTDTTGDPSEDSKDGNIRSFLQYMLGFLNDDSDVTANSDASENLLQAQDPGRDDRDEDLTPAEAAAEQAAAREQKRAAAKDRERTREKIAKNTRTTTGMYNFSKLQNLLDFADAAAPLSVDSILLYDDVEHCYHLGLQQKDGNADDFRRAESLAAEFGMRVSGVTFRYYREQFPCIAEHDALEMLRSL